MLVYFGTHRAYTLWLQEAGLTEQETRWAGRPEQLRGLGVRLEAVHSGETGIWNIWLSESSRLVRMTQAVYPSVGGE